MTINDFANATICKNRLKKSSSNVTKTIDNRTWDEKIEDFDGDFDFVEQENEDGTTSVVIKRHRRKKVELEQREQEGIDYPIDIWFLIAEHIRPEDIGRFAAICKTTFAVICSAKFWFTLYRRYYRNVPNLPERLQPECMVRLYGLRACVIRALHYFYSPFVSSTKAVMTFEEHPHILLKRQCILMWHTKIKNKWIYYFKLKENTTATIKKQGTHQPDLIEMLQDVSANNEEHCRILQATCPHFVSIPPIMGLNLVSVSLTLSQGFKSYRLTMGFASGVSYVARPLDAGGCTEIVLDPVINVSVLDWWHPRYPHSQTTPFIVLNQE